MVFSVLWCSFKKVVAYGSSPIWGPIWVVLYIFLEIFTFGFFEPSTPEELFAQCVDGTLGAGSSPAAATNGTAPPPDGGRYLLRHLVEPPDQSAPLPWIKPIAAEDDENK
jgi:hypothetical protein